MPNSLIFDGTNISFDVYLENKILVKIFEFTVLDGFNL